MVDEAAGSLEKLGLGVAKFRIAPDNRGIDCVWYGGSESGGDSPCRARFRSEASGLKVPGRSRIASDECALELEVSQSGRHWLGIKVRDEAGTLLAQGLGLVDPHDADAVLVSWWTGEREPYGVVKYSIADAQTVTGYYISKMSPDDPGVDTAVGDTTGGFPGSYTLMSREVSGRRWGPHHWTLSGRGEIIDLTWTEHGKIFCRGVGLMDPDDRSSLIATYIPL